MGQITPVTGLLASADDWVTASQIAVAAGTLILAVLTYVAARAASKAASAAEAQVAAQIRPLLIDVEPRIVSPETVGSQGGRIVAEEVRFPDGHVLPTTRLAGSVSGYRSDDRWYLSVPVRNVGTGIALIVGAEMVPAGCAGVPSKPNLPPGEQSRINFVLDESSPALIHARSVIGAGLLESDRPAGTLQRGVPWDGDGVVAIEVTYTDLAGGQLTTTRVDVRRDTSSGSWSVEAIAHRFDKSSHAEVASSH